MSSYIRPKVPGASIFFTVALQNRSSSLLTERIADLRDCVRLTRRERPFRIDAWVVLPDHMHCIWTLPEGDADYATRWSVIKARFSRCMPPVARRSSQLRRREHGIWQRRFWEHHIRDDTGFVALMEYCRINPVKHGLVTCPEEWPFSSFNTRAKEGAQ